MVSRTSFGIFYCATLSLVITIKLVSLCGRKTILRTKASIVNKLGGKPHYSRVLQPLDFEMVKPIQESLF